jgi:endonuclease/exonuclease/phosphatase family metal-dependent hydrolase
MDEIRATHFTRRRLFALGALLLAAFLSYRVFFVYTVRSGNCTADVSVPFRPVEGPANLDREVVIMSYNIEGHAALLDGDHLAEVASVILKEKPEIVGLQEVHRDTWQSRFHDQAEDLARRTGMNVIFGPSVRIGSGEFGNAVLTRGDVLRAVVHPLPSIGEPRTLLQVWVRVGGRPVCFLVTHLVTWGTLTSAVRREQLGCIASHLASTNVPWVLVGDLNATPVAEEISEFASRGEVRGGDPGVPTHGLTRRQLDYVFTDPRWDVLASRVVEGGPSDHKPIVAVLRERRDRGAGRT